MCTRLVYLICFVLVLALLSGSAYAATLLDYDFSDGSGTTVTDLSGSGNHGTLVGFSNTSGGAGVFNSSEGWVTGGGLSFLDDGVRSYVETPLNLSALPGDFTLEFQANYAGASSWVPAIGSNASGCCAESIFFGINSNLTDVEVRLQDSGGPVGPHPWSSPPDTTLHHLALVYDVVTDGVEVFVDGTSIGTATRSAANMAGVTTQFRVANTGWADSEQWDGILFGVAISDQKLGPGSFVIPNRPKVQEKASDPDPDDETTDVPVGVVLSWTPGDFANTHDVYFGTSFDDVNEATKASPEYKTTKSFGDESYAPGLLDFETAYYWRIDEVNAPPHQSTVFKGDIWQFTTEPFAYPITDVNTTASSSQMEGWGPQNTVNGSGLDADDLHSTEDTDMWLSSATGPQPTWIQYEFDKSYKLHQMWVWNYNTLFEPFVGFGLKDVTIEYSTNGTDWTDLGGVPQFTRAPGTDGYAHNTTVDFDGVVAKYVRLTATSNYSGGLVDQYGLSEVRFLYIPVWPREPDPPDGATGLHPDITLSWRAGREAATHKLYLSSNREAVTNDTVAAIPVTEASYDAGTLELGKTYYWKINEVNEAETPATWQGEVWNFAVSDYLVVDDMESYGEAATPGEPGSRIWYTWRDGAGWNEPAPGWGGNGTGAVVGGNFSPYVETTIVNGGQQSMPYFYDNSGSAGKARYSEATADTADLETGSNWTKSGVKALSLWFYGDPDNAATATEQMYVKVSGAKVVYDGDMADIQDASWHEWNIDLADFAALGANLNNVTQVSIGFGNESNTTAGGSGVVYFDDIRLYPARCVPERKTPPAVDISGDCVVDYLDIEIMAADWLITAVAPDDAGLVAHWEFEGDFTDATGKGHDGIAFGDPTIVNDPVRGQVLEVDGDGDRIGFSDAPDLNYGANESLTLTAWANFEPAGADPGWKTIVVKGRTELGGGTGYIDELYGFWVTPSNNWHVNSGGIGGEALAAAEGRWRHLAFVQDGPAGEGHFYIDGEVVISGGADSCDTTGRPLFIGAAGTDVDVDVFEPFKGRIDDVRIYSYALSGGEVLYLAGLPTDLNTDNKVDFKDYAVLADQWLDEQLWP